MKKHLSKTTCFIFSVFFILLLPNCAKYSSKSLIKTNKNIQKKENVIVCQKKLKEKKAKKYFGGRNIEKRNLKAIQLYIKNNSNKTYYLNPNKITLAIEPLGSTARKLHRNVGWKTTKYFIIGGPIWGALEYVASNEANKNINKDFNDKIINPEKIIKIRPYGVINRLVLINKENYVSNFNITLVEAKTKKELSFKL